MKLRNRRRCAIWLCLFIVIAALPVQIGNAQQSDLALLARDAKEAQARNDFDRAAEDYRQIVKEEPHSAEVWANLGLMYHLGKHYSEAVPAFRNSLKENSALFPSNFFLGVDLLALGRAAEAKPFLDKSVRMKPDEAVVLVNAARCDMALGEAESANKLYARATNADSRNASAWFGLGATDLAMMRESLSRLEARPDSPFKRAVLQDKRGAPMSLSVADQRLATNPNDEEALYWRARRMKEAAVDALSKAGALEPDSARTHRILGETYLEQGDYPEARSEFQAWLNLQPTSVSARLAMARVDEADNRQDDALNQALAALQSGKNAEASYIAANVLVREGQYDRALPYAKDALDVKGGAPAEAHALLAKVYEHNDDVNAAIDELKQALPADTDGSYHFRIYRLYEKAGKKEQAAAALVKYRQLKDRPAKPTAEFQKRIEVLLE